MEIENQTGNNDEIENDFLFEDLVTNTDGDNKDDEGDGAADNGDGADGSAVILGEDGKPIDSSTSDDDGDGKDGDNDDADGNGDGDGQAADNKDTGSKDGDDDSKDGEEGSGDDLTGIERYLSQFDIEAGIINFEDGTSKHFDELDPEKQSEVLSQLHSQQASKIEDKYGLDENEINIINYLRENKLTPEQMIEQLATERVQTLMALKEQGSTNYDEMAEDAVYMQFLKRSNPEATPEQLEEDLEKAKQQNNYKNVVQSVRSQFKQEQEFAATKAQQESELEQQRAIEDQRQTVLDTVININDVDGVKINDGTKNGILDHVLEVNDHGDSLFMEEVFGDPEKLFKSAFWFYNGSDLMKQRDDYWKKEKSAAYKRGRESALGKDGSQITFTKKNDSKDNKNGKSTPSQSTDTYTEMDYLHLDN